VKARRAATSARTHGPATAALSAVCAVAVWLAPAWPGIAAQGEASTPAAGVDSQPWYEQYRKAVADSELENWEGVVAKIEEALKTNTKSERSVRTYGMWHASYIPYYYLGLAQYHLGRKTEAMKNLEKEEAAGVVQHDPVAYLKLRKTVAAIKAGTGAGPTGATPSAGPGAGPSATPKPPAAAADHLVEGLQSFFQGDYDKSVAAFQEELKRSTKDDLTLHLYLGMAYAGKASEQASQKAIWTNLAILEFQQVHALDPNYALASGVFSEVMVQLFNEAQKKK
jgi:tetratricopeptide (TPR) repeat protein